MRHAVRLVIMTGLACVLAVPVNAQDTILVPAVPTGVGQIESWVMTVVGGMLTVFVPLVAMWLRSYVASQNALADKNIAVADKNITNQAIVHAAHLADLTMTGQSLTINDVSNPNSPVMLSALDYVNVSRAASGVAEPSPGDDHTAQAVVAEIHKLQSARSGNEPPSIVLSPVSAIK